jgi:hypothetical protein
MSGAGEVGGVADFASSMQAAVLTPMPGIEVRTPA